MCDPERERGEQGRPAQRDGDDFASAQLDERHDRGQPLDRQSNQPRDLQPGLDGPDGRADGDQRLRFDSIRVKGNGPAVLRDLVIQDIHLPGPGTRGGKGVRPRPPEHRRHRRARAHPQRLLGGGPGPGPRPQAARPERRHLWRFGVYVEHYTHRMLLEDFRMGPGIGRASTSSGTTRPVTRGAPTSVGATIQDGLNEAYRIGVAVMDGQKDTTVQRVTFRNQCGAAIIGHRPRSTGRGLRRQQLLWDRSRRVRDHVKALEFV